MDVKNWAKIQEELLKSQLKTIRQFLREGKMPARKPRRKGRSQMSIIHDILLAARQPLHITEIIELAEKDFNVILERESVVSALTKKVRSGIMFKRVKPNTFAILDDTSESDNK
ncbi:MAG: hypothetical protein U9M96_05790 [Thermodesulfobacteriota bacterium]|nr:hypothetical protein [Thermodesulfobacteriota bacterium]